MRRFQAILLVLGTATLAVGCGATGDRDRPRSAPDGGHPNLLTQADVLPEGHPPIDPHHPWRVLPEGHPALQGGGLVCPRGGLGPDDGSGPASGAAQEAPTILSI